MRQTVSVLNKLRTQWSLMNRQCLVPRLYGTVGLGVLVKGLEQNLPKFYAKESLVKGLNDERYADEYAQ